MPSLVSTIPGVTEISRASLLAGKVTRGHSGDDAKKGRFATHPSNFLDTLLSKSVCCVTRSSGNVYGSGDGAVEFVSLRVPAPLLWP